MNQEKIWHFVCIDCDLIFNDPDSAGAHISIWDHTIKGGIVNE